MDPTLNDIREDIATEREMKAEQARVAKKVGLLKALAAASEDLKNDLAKVEAQRDELKEAKKAVKAIADNDNLTTEEILEVLKQVNNARGIASFAVAISSLDFAGGPRVPQFPIEALKKAALAG